VKRPEDKLTEDDQDHILEELRTVFGGKPKGELPHLRSFRLEESALIYVCTNHQPGLRLLGPLTIIGGSNEFIVASAYLPNDR
jgi:hypothetical protein